MIPFHSRPFLEARLLATAALIASLPLFAAYATERDGNGSAFTPPAEIDRAVESFTGAAPGEVGGAIRPADQRLRLAACKQPLGVEWFGNTRTSVAVTCDGPQAWRIFVSTRPTGPASKASPVISRGDPVTVQVRGRGFTVQKAGEALEAGSVGDWISIRMTSASGSGQREDPIRARLARPGLAIIQ